MTPRDFIRAARVPDSLDPQSFGPWTIRRVRVADVKNAGLAEFMQKQLEGFESQTILYKLTMGTMMKEPGDIVMEDSPRELRTHMPIWRAAHGRVLITGLGLGCVVRGLLASPAVRHVDVVEIDAGILRVVGEEFRGNHRVTLHQGDALTYDFGPATQWDCAWHDLYIDDSAADLHIAHCTLLRNYRERVAQQGAWRLPRWVKRLVTKQQPLLGAPRRGCRSSIDPNWPPGHLH